MVAIKKMPKETLAELVEYIADNESFCCIEKNLCGSMELQEVREALKELSLELKREAALETGAGNDVRSDKIVSKKARDLLACLSTYEEKKLLRAFGFGEV